MPLAMPRPTPHPKSGVYHLRKAIPKSLRPVAKRLYGVSSELTVTLGTKDPQKAKRASPAALAELESKLAAIREAADAPPRRLSFLQVQAVAGVWYNAQLAAMQANPGKPSDWDERRSNLLDDATYTDGGEIGDYQPSARDIREAEGELLTQEILADPESIRAVAQALWVAKVQLAETMIRRARGDYGPDEYANRFPPQAVLSQDKPTLRPGPAVGPTFENIVKGWARDHGHDPDAERPTRAVYERLGTVKRLARFLGHDNAAQVTKADAVRWKEAMQKDKDKPKSLKTISNDINELSAIWGWAAKHELVAANPFDGVSPPASKKKRGSAERSYTPEQAAMILGAARNETKGTLRWVPWVLALTGARLAEVVQARKDDIVYYDGLPFLRVHDDGENEEVRSVKNDASVRKIPIHPALVEEGFLEYVTALPHGSPLFPDSKPGAKFNNRADTATKIIGRWVRHKLKLADRRIAPCHSWRHWFIGAARESISNFELRNAITGHTDDVNESHHYGLGYRDMPEKLYEAICLIKPPIPPMPASGTKHQPPSRKP